MQDQSSSMGVDSKRCPQCGEVKPLSEFFRDRNRRDGLCCWCKPCQYAASEVCRRRRLLAKKLGRPADLPVARKRCKDCGVVKPPWEFYVARTNRDGLDTRCKECHLAFTKASRRRRQHAGEAPRERRPLAERFAAKVEVTDGCWLWRGGRNIREKGYGTIGVGFGSMQAHRAAYELYVGPIPEGYEVHHTCENQSCVRPDHLEALTPLEHARRHAKAT